MNPIDVEKTATALMRKLDFAPMVRRASTRLERQEIRRRILVDALTTYAAEVVRAQRIADALTTSAVEIARAQQATINSLVRVLKEHSIHLSSCGVFCCTEDTCTCDWSTYTDKTDATPGREG